MKDFLTPEQVTELRARHRAERDGKVRDRIKAVLWHNEGKTLAEIARLLFLDEGTIAVHLYEFEESQKLTLESGGSESKLSGPKLRMLVAELSENLYATTNAIIAWVESKWGISYTVAGMNTLLHRLGFSYKQPSPVPAKADPEMQAAFIAKYTRLMARKAPEDLVFFADATHPTMATKIGKGWIRTGENRPIPTTGQRHRVNVLGALNLETMALFTQSHTTVDTSAVVAQVAALRERNRQAGVIHLIMDNASYNKSKPVRKAARKHRVRLHYLPPYSPNLNPIERVWKVMAEDVRNNRFFESFDEFRCDIGYFFTTLWPRKAERLRSRINDNFQTLQPGF